MAIKRTGPNTIRITSQDQRITLTDNGDTITLETSHPTTTINRQDLEKAAWFLGTPAPDANQANNPWKETQQ